MSPMCAGITRLGDEPSAIRIEPDGLYDDETLRLMLGVTSATLARARRQGLLRYSRRGRRIFYFGRWILEWMCPRPRNKQKNNLQE